MFGVKKEFGSSWAAEGFSMALLLRKSRRFPISERQDWFPPVFPKGIFRSARLATCHERTARDEKQAEIDGLGPETTCRRGPPAAPRSHLGGLMARQVKVAVEICFDLI